VQRARRGQEYESSKDDETRSAQIRTLLAFYRRTRSHRLFTCQFCSLVIGAFERTIELNQPSKLPKILEHYSHPEGADVAGALEFERHLRVSAVQGKRLTANL
jgi:hypothetical protein